LRESGPRHKAAKPQLFEGRVAHFAMSQGKVLQQHLTELEGKLDVMVDLSGRNKVLAAQEGHELEDQVDIIGGENRQFDDANQGIIGAIEDEHKLMDMGKGNCAGWILSILMLLGIIIVWVIPK
jgi:hypothetical protein